jgi:hypothetical protein
VLVLNNPVMAVSSIEHSIPAVVTDAAAAAAAAAR